jgi:hypothetical protein
MNASFHLSLHLAALQQLKQLNLRLAALQQLKRLNLRLTALQQLKRVINEVGMSGPRPDIPTSFIT